MSETVMAYDHTGNHLIPTSCQVGDIVEWKRSGVRGTYLCRVLDFKPDKIKLQPLRHSWRSEFLSGARPIWAKRYVMRVLTSEQAAARGISDNQKENQVI